VPGEKAKNLGIRVSEHRSKELKHLCADLGISVQRLVELALDTYLSHLRDTSPNLVIAASEMRSGIHLPSGLEQIRIHLEDPTFVQSLLALARIWTAGDKRTKDAIADNCEELARLSCARHH
jgi:hypothetical protein